MIDDDLALLDRLEAGVAVADADDRLVRWNDCAERLTGLKAADVIGRRWTDFIELVGGDPAGGGLIRASDLNPGGWDGIGHIKTGDRSVRIRGHIFTWRSGDRPGLAGVFWAAPDEEAPASDSSAYRGLMTRSPEALVMIDGTGDVLDVNDAAIALFARSRADLVGSRLRDLALEWSESDRAAAWKEILDAGSITRTIEVRRGEATPDDARQVAAVEVIATLIPGSSGNRVLMRLRDVTGSVEREQLLRDLAAIARVGEEPSDVDVVCAEAVDVLTRIWSADAGLLARSGAEGLVFCGSQSGDRRLLAAASAFDGSTVLRGRLNGAERPFRLTAEECAEAGLSAASDDAGYETIWASPLWFADRRIGFLALAWRGRAPDRLTGNRLEQTVRVAGMAVGNAQFQTDARRDAARRASLEDSARVAKVVLDQIREGIVTVDAGARVTAFNPAAQQIYGISEKQALGRKISEIVAQFHLDGSPSNLFPNRGKAGDHWQGRVIHRPLVGRHPDAGIVVDLSLTAIRDGKGARSGSIGVVRPVSQASHLDSDAAMLGSLAVALSRARSLREVGEASAEQLCRGTNAEMAAVITWKDPAAKSVVGSRGLSDAMVDLLETGSMPPLVEARKEPGSILPLERILELIGNLPGADVVLREGIASGFITDLRTRDRVVGTLVLGSRRPGWTRPTDEVVLQVASQIANAIENARYLDEERRLTAKLEAMLNLMRLPEGQISETGVAYLLLSRISEALEADGGVVVRVEDGRSRVVASKDLPDPMREMLDGAPAASLHFWRRLVARGGTPVHEHLDETAETDPEIAHASRTGVESQAVFPIREGDALIGAFVCHFYAGRPQDVTLDDRSLEAIGRVISIAYANVRLSEGLAEAAGRERHLAAELRALQELTLLGASTDALETLARETADMVVLSAGAAGGGYFLLDESLGQAGQICWVGQPSRRWPDGGEVAVPSGWPALKAIVAGEGAWLSGEAGECGGECEAVLPLRVEDALVGFLHLEWAGEPNEEEFNGHFLSPIARVCSISLANFRLRSELVHRAAEQQSLNLRLRTLDNLTQIGEQASSFEELAHRTVSLVREVLGASGVCYLLMESGHHFDTHAVAGETGAFRLWLKGVPARDAPGGRLLLSGSDSVLENFVAGHVHDRVLPLARATGFASFGAIPIRTGEELAGALLCFFEDPVERLSITESALDSVARIAGIALANYRLRDSLSSSEERYRTLFAQTPDALFVSALDGTVLDANEAAVRAYRINRGEMLGRYIGLLISADEREMARRRQIVWAQGRGTFRDRGRRHDGSEFPVSVEIRVVELDGQRRFLYLIRDMSDEERLHGELLQAQKMEAIGSLVSGVAHELNNPLTGIIGFGGLLNSDPRLPDDMRNLAGLLVQEADRTKRIVQNLLDFARARKPERRPTRLGALVQSVLDLQSYAIAAGQIVVEVDIPDDIPEIELDRAAFQQVFLNLAINAIQAMRADTRTRPHHLWIRAQLVGAPRAHARSTDAGEGQRIRITVRDDGPGVPEANRNNLFVPFFTTKEPGEGTGLGLSVSFGIVAAHGGDLYYEPGPDDVGSCFIIEMPVKPSPGAEDQPSFSSVDAMTALTERTVPRRARGRGATRREGAAGAASKTRDGEPPADAAPEETEVPEPMEAALEPPEPGAAGPAVETAAEPAEPAAAGPAGAEPAEPAAAEPVAPAGAERPAARPRVLILDDEPVIRELLRRALSSAGMEPHPFQDGAQALDGVQQIIFDVMLIDHRMAGMSGTEFYQFAVSTRPELAKRAIFMSGDVLNPDLRDFAVQRGIRLVQKPFEPSQVISAVREALEEAAAAN